MLMSMSIFVSRRTLNMLDELKKELKEKFGFEPSYNKIILYLIKFYKEQQLSKR